MNPTWIGASVNDLPASPAYQLALQHDSHILRKNVSHPQQLGMIHFYSEQTGMPSFLLIGIISSELSISQSPPHMRPQHIRLQSSHYMPMYITFSHLVLSHFRANLKS